MNKLLILSIIIKNFPPGLEREVFKYKRILPLKLIRGNQMKVDSGIRTHGLQDHNLTR